MADSWQNKTRARNEVMEAFRRVREACGRIRQAVNSVDSPDLIRAQENLRNAYGILGDLVDQFEEEAAIQSRIDESIADMVKDMGGQSAEHDSDNLDFEDEDEDDDEEEDEDEEEEEEEED